jgi:hypothetical protein
VRFETAISPVTTGTISHDETSRGWFVMVGGFGAVDNQRGKACKEAGRRAEGGAIVPADQHDRRIDVPGDESIGAPAEARTPLRFDRIHCLNRCIELMSWCANPLGNSAGEKTF